YRVTAFVPKTGSNDLQHEFRFLGPWERPCTPGRYELSGQGLETTEQEPQIDRGFVNVLFRLDNQKDKWTPEPNNYFVTLELPAPEAITYIPPLYPALFDSGHDSGTRLGSVPLSHVLEYRVRNADDLRLTPRQSQSCGAEINFKPWSSAQLLKNYKDMQQGMRD